MLLDKRINVIDDIRRMNNIIYVRERERTHEEKPVTADTTEHVDKLCVDFCFRNPTTERAFRKSYIGTIAIESYKHGTMCYMQRLDEYIREAVKLYVQIVLSSKAIQTVSLLRDVQLELNDRSISHKAEDNGEDVVSVGNIVYMYRYWRIRKHEFTFNGYIGSIHDMDGMSVDLHAKEPRSSGFYRSKFAHIEIAVQFGGPRAPMRVKRCIKEAVRLYDRIVLQNERQRPLKIKTFCLRDYFRMLR